MFRRALFVNEQSLVLTSWTVRERIPLRCLTISIHQSLALDQGCPTAAREVVLSGPRCNKFVSRLFKFSVCFYRLKYICHEKTPKLHLLFLLWAYHPKTCTTKASKICQFFIWFTSIQAGNSAYNYRTHYHLVLSHKT